MEGIRDKEVTTYIMSKIKGKDTKPEMLVRKFLFSKGFRYRIHDKRFVGKPDIVLPKYNTIIFINGCFWHGHKNCKLYTVPKTRTQWWLNKIGNNKAKDAKYNRLLKKEGWNVINIWECQLKPKTIVRTLDLLYNKLIKLNP